MTLDIFFSFAEGLACKLTKYVLKTQENTFKHTIKEFAERYEPNGMTVLFMVSGPAEKQT
jgi:hypothetical protein